MFKKIKKYSLVLVGMGIGILITYPLVVTHPVRWGALFIGLGLLAHLYPLKK